MTDKHKTVFVDTNIFIRYLIGEDDHDGIKAKTFLHQVQSGKIKAHLIESVFTEIIFVLSKFYEVPRYEIADTLTALLQYKGIINDHKDDLLQALENFKNSNLHIVDCLLAAKSKLNKKELVTFDQKLVNFITLRATDDKQ